ncbi:hypothetical protein UFOVP1361_29 [uncultured Caudovirales phage]|uniref:Uncharacterized protein n=1 Tax=uncultured Caudovirales phage TaxID=2100421 RepID=A0A6J5S2S6_9CAUD|nr:hypothetical protein UFOVP1361_29 [uncultured Caudovirales phage]
MDPEKMKASIQLWQAACHMQSIEVQMTFCQIMECLVIEEGEDETITLEDVLFCKERTQHILNVINQMECSTSMLKRALNALMQDIQMHEPKSADMFLN